MVVKDTGIGIAEENMSRALAPFMQVETELDRSYEGTGLGLPIAIAMTELHGGTLTLTSEPGVGTEVVVAIPATRARKVDHARAVNS